MRTKVVPIMDVLQHRRAFLPVYRALKENPDKNRTVLDTVDDRINSLKGSNQPLGIHHRFQTIPKTYARKYSLQSLYHFELPADYRLMYTVRRGQNGKEALLLQILTHDQYNKILGYFKKKSH